MEKESFADLFHSNKPVAAAPTVKLIQTYKEEPTLILREEDTSSAAPFSCALIGKFSYGKPSMETLRQDFLKLELIPSQSEDYMKIWLWGQWAFQGFPMRVFKWSPKFHVSAEPSIIPSWIIFENLPVHLFQKATLFSLASAIGKPLKLDEPTANLTRPSIATVCIELDLLKPHVYRIWIGASPGKGFWQLVGYEDVLSYCSSCRRLECSMEAATEENADNARVAQKLNDAPIPLPIGQLIDDVHILLQIQSNAEYSGEQKDDAQLLQQDETTNVSDSEIQHGNDTNPLLLTSSPSSVG
ncbi:hypothetical protein M9H77_08121 [Catharanthus roseus]|uniref:Uncharacterized protein n=1 Tax=Catharanthus roseus TaxID=4058 RepID=A0ACC0BX79_CATRO|nr:hypothetical protein M9H77_08121 [Catharanthus roseus]